MHTYLVMGRLWHFMGDMNLDGIISFRDVPSWAGWLFYYPGDLLVYLLLSDYRTARFFEMTAYDYGGRLSLVASIVAWLLIVAAPFSLRRLYFRVRGRVDPRTTQRVAHKEWAARKAHHHHKRPDKKDPHKPLKPVRP